jgi:dTDP-4-amino-4,6-dideoxygalactose transaminase
LIPVTRPFLPPLDELIPYLERIWDSRILSNCGPLHIELEKRLAALLGVEHVSMFANATMALMVAQRVLKIKGEVITTPYTFVATANSIIWANNVPKFVDVDPESLTLDPVAVEAAIGEKTAAVMPVHCYGSTADTKAFDELSARYGIKIIYDACHSFGVDDEGGSVLRHGDISVVSLHATKIFNTFEGGILITSSESIKTQVDLLKNFGFVDEITVSEIGLNAKMSEINAAVGLAQIPYFSKIIAERREIDKLYRTLLKTVPGVEIFEPARQTRHNYAYFPIFIGDEHVWGRDQLVKELVNRGVYARKYFYPLVPEFDSFRNIDGTTPRKSFPRAEQAANRVICLPIYPGLPLAKVHEICQVVAGIDLARIG